MGAAHFPFNLTITRGDDRVVPLEWYNEDGSPVDLTDWDFYYTIKAEFDDDVTDSEAIVALDPADFVKSAAVDGAVDNIVTFLIPRAATKGMIPGTTYLNDLQILFGGRITTIGKGVVAIEPEVTVRE